MVLDLFSAWCRQANEWILLLFNYIYPEYPEIGIPVFIAGAIFFVYFLVKGEFKLALKMGLSTIVFFAFVLFSLHCLMKIFKVVI